MRLTSLTPEDCARNRHSAAGSGLMGLRSRSCSAAMRVLPWIWTLNRSGSLTLLRRFPGGSISCGASASLGWDRIGMNSSLSILMLEDSEADALFVLRELRRGGYEPVELRVDTEPGFQAALTARQWDIIIADY